MAKLNTTQLAELIGITKQAVSKAAREGIIKSCGMKGKSPLYDTEDDTVKFYIETNPQSGPREKPSKKPVKKSAKKKSTSKKVVKKSTKKDKVYLKPDENYDDLSAVEINLRAKIADMQKKQMHVEILQKKFVNTEYVQDHLFRYLEKLNSTIERSSGVFINEVGQKILEAGEVQPEHIESFVNLCLEAIHNTKSNIIKDIKKYEPKI